MADIANLLIGKILEQNMKKQESSDELENVAKQIAIMMKVANQVPAGSGIMAKPRALFENTKQLVGLNPNLDTWEGLRQGIMASQTARKMGGEKGALSEGDVQRMTKSLPSSWDSAEAKKQKFSIIKQILEQQSGRDFTNIFGVQ